MKAPVCSMRLAAVAILIALLIARSGSAQETARVRGEIVAINEGGLTIHETDGRRVILAIGPYTTYAYVVPSNVGPIHAGTFIGAAVKGPMTHLTAVEAALIPRSLQAGRISMYAWDPLPDPTAATAGTLVPTRMINGLVVQVAHSPATFPSAPGAAQPVIRRLTVNYDRNKKHFVIEIPSSAPVVRYVRASRSAATVGSTVMIKTAPGAHATLVTIGKGVMPPM